MSDHPKKRRSEHNQAAKRAEVGQQERDKARKLTLDGSALFTKAVKCSVANKDEDGEGDQTHVDHSEPLLRVVAHQPVKSAQTGVGPAVEQRKEAGEHSGLQRSRVRQTPVHRVLAQHRLALVERDARCDEPGVEHLNWRDKLRDRKRQCVEAGQVVQLGADGLCADDEIGRIRIVGITPAGAQHQGINGSIHGEPRRLSGLDVALARLGDLLICWRGILHRLNRCYGAVKVNGEPFAALPLMGKALMARHLKLDRVSLKGGNPLATSAVAGRPKVSKSLGRIPRAPDLYGPTVCALQHIDVTHARYDELHGSGLHGRMRASTTRRCYAAHRYRRVAGAMAGGNLGPNQVPVVWAEVFAGHSPTRHALNGYAVFGGWLPIGVAVPPLTDLIRLQAEPFGQLFDA